MCVDMEHEDILIKDVKYLNGEDRDPKVTIKYSGKPMDGSSREDVKRTKPDLPHKAFRKAWTELVQYWKENIKKLLCGNEGDIPWGFDSIRMRQVKIDWRDDSEPGMVSYKADIIAPFDEGVTVPTPLMQPTMINGEIEAIREFASHVKDFLHGATDQGSLFDDTDEPDNVKETVSSEDTEEDDKIEIDF